MVVRSLTRPLTSSLVSALGTGDASEPPEAVTLTLTADDPAFTAGSGGNPAQINYLVVYDGEDDLTACLVTSDSATAPDRDDIIAGSGTGIIEGTNWPEAGGSLDLTGLTSLSNGDKYLYLVVKEDNGAAVSDVLPITATGLDFTNPAHSSAATSTDGLTVTATMTESMVGTEATGDWVVKVGGSAITVSAVSISGTDIALTVSPAIANGDTVTYSYSGGDLEDAQGNPLGTITDQGVTNNVPAAGLTRTYLGQEREAANNGTLGQYDFTDTTLGAGPVAVVVNVITPASGRTISSVTIGGNAATLANAGGTNASASNSTVVISAIYFTNATPGSNTVRVQLSGDAADSVTVHVYSFSGPVAVETAANSVATSPAAPFALSLNMNVSAGASVLAGAGSLSGGSFTGYDAFVGVAQNGTNLGSSGQYGCAASAEDVSAATPMTLSLGGSTSPTRAAAAAASFIEA